jgi:hypothetical protein
MHTTYSENVLQMMRDHSDKLPERLRREYAAIESFKLGYGGISYVCSALDIDRKTVQRGRKELAGLCDTVCVSRQRKAGGGRKKKLQTVAIFVKN